MPDAFAVGEAYPIVAKGPAAQLVVPASVHGLGANIAASGSQVSNILPSDGYSAIAIGITSSQAGSISVQRYLDLAATIPMGAPVTAALTAATAASLTVNDGAIFRSYIITLNNSGGSAATLTKLAVVQQA